MNFGREQALLRQRLTAAGTKERAAEDAACFGDGRKYLGAPSDECDAAALDLTEEFPEMGRAQMTAFVRTLWRSKTHELQQVAVGVLARRSELLESPDVPFVLELLDAATDQLSDRIAEHVLGPLVSRNKKHWRDLQKIGKRPDLRLRRAAVLASRVPLANDGSVFDRFEKLATPMLDSDDDGVDALQETIESALQSAAAQAPEPVANFAARHGLDVAVADAIAAGDKVVAVEPQAPAPKANTRKVAAGKSATGKSAAGKSAAGKSAVGKANAGKSSNGSIAAAKAPARSAARSATATRDSKPTARKASASKGTTSKNTASKSTARKASKAPASKAPAGKAPASKPAAGKKAQRRPPRRKKP